MKMSLAPEKRRVLIIEDEESIRQGLINLFVYHGMDVIFASDGEFGLELALKEKLDLIILDIMLPKKDGFTVCSEIRKARPRVPIIMLTARVSEDDIVNGLELGADDYIGKPFSVRELLSRAQNILRRNSEPSSSLLYIGDNLVLNFANLEGINKINGNKIIFTLREVELLKYLQSQDGRAKTREELLFHVWGYKESSDIDTRTVDIHIAKLRKKIETDAKNPENLITVRGVGYRLMTKG